MPRKSKGPYLYFYKKEKTWLIRDADKTKRTGCGENEVEAANRALAEYIAEKWRPETTEHRPGSVLFKNVIMTYAELKIPEKATKHRRNELAAQCGRLIDYCGDDPLTVVNGAWCRAYVKRSSTVSMARHDLEIARAAVRFGKTEAIVRTVGTYCSDPQLILTHTHAGVDALRQRFRKHQVPTSRYHVDTIAGWAWSWVRKYPLNAGYDGPGDVPGWNDVYDSMSALLERDFVKQGILNSYAGVIVDEYQDCTVPMHKLMVQLKCLLPCRVLGDDLQGIFGFRDDPL